MLNHIWHCYSTHSTELQWKSSLAFLAHISCKLNKNWQVINSLCRILYHINKEVENLKKQILLNLKTNFILRFCPDIRSHTRIFILDLKYSDTEFLSEEIFVFAHDYKFFQTVNEINRNIFHFIPSLEDTV